MTFECHSNDSVHTGGFGKDSASVNCQDVVFGVLEDFDTRRPRKLLCQHAQMNGVLIRCCTP